MHLARVLGQPPDPGVGLVAAADPPLDHRAQHDLRRLPALVPRPAADDVDCSVERVRVTQRGDVRQRAQSQLRILVALHGRDQKAALQLAATVEVQHRPSPAPTRRRHAGTGQCRPHVLLAVVEVLDGDPPQLALEHREPPLLLRAHRQHPALHAHPPPAPTPDRSDHDRPTAVDVTIEQRVQRHDRIVVLGRGVHEVHDKPRLLAGVATGHAPDALLIDAFGGRRREVHAHGRPRAVPALGQQLRVDQHVDVPALVASENLRELALGRFAETPCALIPSARNASARL